MAGYKITVNEALEEGLKKEFALIYKLSEVYAGRTQKDFILDDEVIEAHFFDEEGEIRLLRYEGVMKASKVVEQTSEVSLEKECGVKGSNVRLIYKEILVSDEDGQYRTQTKRLVGLKGVE